jgi:hypothetical protein
VERYSVGTVAAHDRAGGAEEDRQADALSLDL